MSADAVQSDCNLYDLYPKGLIKPVSHSGHVDHTCVHPEHCDHSVSHDLKFLQHIRITPYILCHTCRHPVLYYTCDTWCYCCDTLYCITLATHGVTLATPCIVLATLCITLDTPCITRATSYTCHPASQQLSLSV